MIRKIFVFAIIFSSFSFVSQWAVADFACSPAEGLTPQHSYLYYVTPSYFVPPVDCFKKLQEIGENKPENLTDQVLELLAHIDHVESSLAPGEQFCTATAFQQAFKLTPADGRLENLANELNRVGCARVATSELLSVLSPDTLKALSKVSIVDPPGNAALVALLKWNWTADQLDFLEQTFFHAASSANFKEVEAWLRVQAGLLQKFFIVGVKWDAKAEALVKRILADYLVLYNHLGTPKPWDLNAYRPWLESRSTAHLAEFLRAFTDSGWDINAPVVAGPAAKGCALVDSQQLTPFLQMVLAQRIDLVDLALKTTNANPNPFGHAGTTAYASALSTRNRDLIGTIGAKSETVPSNPECPYPATTTLLRVLNEGGKDTDRLNLLAMLPGDEKNLKNRDLANALSSLLYRGAGLSSMELAQELEIVQFQIVPLQDLFSGPWLCQSGASGELAQLFIAARSMNVNLSAPIDTCLQKSLATAARLDSRNAHRVLDRLNLFLVTLKNAGVEDAIERAQRALAAQPVPAEERFLKAISRASGQRLLQLERHLRKTGK